MKATLPVFAWLVCFAAPSFADEVRVDKSGEFEYRLPDGWSVVPASQAPHDILLLPGNDGSNRNLVIHDQPGDSEFAVLKEKYERNLAQGLKGFELISSEIIKLKHLGQAIRIIHTNTHPGVPVRQINFIVASGGKRYFIACTVLKSDLDKYDAAVLTFVDALRPK